LSGKPSRLPLGGNFSTVFCGSRSTLIEVESLFLAQEYLTYGQLYPNGFPAVFFKEGSVFVNLFVDLT